jgi:diguanylate cyclase (GGDEF)-like protein
VFSSREERNGLVTELAAARSRIAELEAELARNASHDPIAGGLLTLRSFRTQLELELERARRYARPLAVALLDIDRFRYVNLKHGFAAGDAVLRAVGSAIGQTTRVNDLACRAGGDEYAMLFPETEAPGVLGALQRLLVTMEGVQAGPVTGISASIGIAAHERGQSPEELFASAAKALERARAAGGGQAVLYAPGHEENGDAGPAAHGDIIAALASTLGERDRYTGDHLESVVGLAARVGEALAMDAERVGVLRTAALLHDIGKVGIPDEVLHKDGPLDEREWEMMREHPAIGERILRAIPGMGSVARVVRHEHERWDGAGYPDGLVGEAIPLEARIILACDAYHAMTSDRPYRKAMPHHEAVTELTVNAGTQFDPDVVEALVGILFAMRQTGALAV